MRTGREAKGWAVGVAVPTMGSAEGALWRTTHRSSPLIMGTMGPVCVALWSEKPTPTTFEVQRRLLAESVFGSPGRSAFLCVVGAQTEPPEQAVRDASAQMIASHHGRLAAVACVVEGSGFRAAITRTVLSGMMLLIRNSPPVRVFETTALATPWLSSTLDGLKLPSLADAVAHARRGVSS